MTHEQQKIADVGTFRFYGDQFVFNRHSGFFYRLTPEAKFVLTEIIGGAAQSDLAGLLRKKYDLDRATAVRDAALFYNRLEQMGLLENGGIK